MNVETEEIELTTPMVCNFIEQATSEELSEILKSTTKRSLQLLKGKTSKSRGVATGAVPVQFVKYNAWADMVLAYATQNGWESFPMKSADGVVEMDGSVEKEDGGFMFPSGKAFTRAHALCLGKHLKATSSQLWLDFNSTLSDDMAPKAVASKPQPVRISQADAEAKKAAEKAVKEAAAAAKKLEREAIAAAKKAEKEVAKALEKAEKEAKKAAEKAEKEAALAPRKAITVVKRVATPSPPPATVVAKPVESFVTPRALPKVAAAPKAVAKVVKKKDEWVCAEGEVKPWAYKGKKYLRNSDNAVWEFDEATEGYGAWVGVYLPSEDEFDTSAVDPDLEVEDEESA